MNRVRPFLLSPLSLPPTGIEFDKKELMEASESSSNNKQDPEMKSGFEKLDN